MGWFTRGRDEADEERDPELPLSVLQAQRLRGLVRTAWAEAGREVTVYSDHVEDASGGTFGLWNLAATVADAPPRRWPRLVATHVQRLATPGPGIADLTDSQLHDQLVLRLAEGTSLPEPWFPTAPTLVGDLREVLVIDFPDTVITPSERELAARGDLDAWRAVGRANLWRLMRSERRECEVVRRGDGGDFHVLMGDSVYTASMTLFLPELLSLAGQPAGHAGVLVALPFRNQVGFRLVDGPGAAGALRNLFLFAMAGYDEAPGPLSPHVFWVSDGRWVQLTRRDDEGARIEVPADLARALGIAGDA